MSIPNTELLQKAFTGLQDSDFGDATEAPLAVEQVKTFIELMTAGQSFLPAVRTVSHSAPKWIESVVDFGSQRVMRRGLEGERHDANHRSKPATDRVELDTELLRGEVPVSDEVLEDNVAGPAFVASLDRLIADRAGFDVEELMVGGTADGRWDPLGAEDEEYLETLEGWIKQAETSGHAYDATADGQDYQSVFRTLILQIPDRHLRGLDSAGRFWVPKRVETLYRDALSGRDTALGDVLLESNRSLMYQGIKISGASTIPVGFPDANESFFLLAHDANLYAGFQRAMKFESFRDPREGATSFIVTARVDAKIAIPDAVAIATDVNVAI